MARFIKAEFSVTETKQFRILVEFLASIRGYAEVADDYELQALVRECEDRLREVSR